MTLENGHHLMTVIIHLNSLFSYCSPLGAAQYFFLPLLSISSLQQVTLKNHCKLTCLTTNGGFLSPGSLKLLPRFSGVGWCMRRHLGEDGVGTRGWVPLGSRSGLFSFGLVFLLFVGALCPCDFDEDLCDLYLSSWKQKKDEICRAVSFC